MKRFLLYLLVVATIVACSKSDDVGGGNNNNNETPKQPEVTLSTTTADFSTDGGSNVITFTSSEAWTAQVVNTRADEWCSIEPTSGPAGSAKITVTTTENDTPDDRTASIIIKAGTASKTINVSQKQKDALTVTSSKFEVSAEGGEVLIEVKANIDFEYAIEESADDWVEYKATRALKTSNLVFKVKENDDTDKREARITITSGEFNEIITIYQAGSEPSIILTENEFTVSSSAETVAVEVKSNVDVTVEIPDDVDWIKENTTRAFSTNTYYFEIEQNDGYDNRTAQIKFTNKETGIYEYVTITQMQRDAIVLAKSEYELGTEGGELDFDIQTNVDIMVTISDNAKLWITQIETRGLETKTLHFDIAACAAEEDREGTITISGGNAIQTITVKQSGLKEVLEKEREALIAFYKATGGDNWTHNDNWCSDKPVSEWYGINVYDISTGEPFNSRRVKSIHLPINNLVGELPKELFNLSELKDIYITDNYGLQGVIPKEIGQLNKLERLLLYSNSLSGDIPKELWTLTKLQEINISNNDLTGSIDPIIGNLTDLKILELNDNNISGSIPAEIVNLTNLRNLNIAENKLTGSIPADIGNMRNLIYLQLCDNHLSGNIPESIYQIPTLNLLHLARNKLSGEIPESLGDCLALEELFLDSNELTGSVPASLSKIPTLNYLHLGSNKLSGEIPSALGNCPALEVLCLYDNELTGNLPEEIINIHTLKELRIHNNKLDGECSELLSAFIEDLDYYSIYQQDGYELKLYFYHSTDFSQDGKVITLQQHTKGPGIKFVITMDGFSDRQIADGTVNNYINSACEILFSEEPYTSFKEYFDVYAVLTVSKREKIFTDTALKTDGYGDTFSLQHDLVEAYAKKIPEINNDMSNTHILVILNDKSGVRASCSWTSYGSMSCASVIMEDNSSRFDRVIRHEVLGHGFGRLADEYVEVSDPLAGEDKDLFKNFPEEEKQNVRNEHQKGWYLNVDVTNDPEKIVWKDFLKNNDYSAEEIGIYEGALYYERGAYRATPYSIMTHNEGGFNAPSRWSIYKHIMEIAGEDYSFETFLEYDKKNLVHTRSVVLKSAQPASIDPSKLGAKPRFLNR